MLIGCVDRLPKVSLVGNHFPSCEEADPIAMARWFAHCSCRSWIGRAGRSFPKSPRRHAHSHTRAPFVAGDVAGQTGLAGQRSPSAVNRANHLRTAREQAPEPRAAAFGACSLRTSLMIRSRLGFVKQHSCVSTIYRKVASGYFTSIRGDRHRNARASVDKRKSIARAPCFTEPFHRRT